MILSTLSQPESQLGIEFSSLLETDGGFKKIILVSAFTALRTILRLRERMLAIAESGAMVRLIVGIDLGGTSREVLEELLQWNCDVFVYHNPLPRSTFHPKIYLFERERDSVLFIGSNNLTDGGLYTNYEAYTRCLFAFPADVNEYERLLRPLLPFLNPEGSTVCRVDAALIETLSKRGILASEIEARRSHLGKQKEPLRNDVDFPKNPFSPIYVPAAPLLSKEIRSKSLPRHRIEIPQNEEVAPPRGQPHPEGVLVWRKVITKTDALQVNPGSHHVGGIRLTQAEFENPPGHKIDQTTYFRALFDDFGWESERGRHKDQEHAFVPMRIIINGHDYGVRNFEISHKPSGEAGQDNYTTILRWGRNFNRVIIQENITDAIFSLYETPDGDAPFLIEIASS